MYEQGFKLWSNAMNNELEFQKIIDGNEADIVIGIKDLSTAGFYGYWTNTLRPETNTINTAAIVMHKYLNDPEFLTWFLHELGNVLGLGDILCTDKIQSVMEECNTLNPKTNSRFRGEELWPYDKALIQKIYIGSN